MDFVVHCCHLERYFFLSGQWRIKICTEYNSVIKFNSMSMQTPCQCTRDKNYVNICVANFCYFFLFFIGVSSPCDSGLYRVYKSQRYNLLPRSYGIIRSASVPVYSNDSSLTSYIVPTFESKFSSQGIAVPWHLFHWLPRVTSEFRMQRVVGCFVIEIQTTNTKLTTP